MSVPRNAIFISYRRSDSVYAVDQLDERLTQAFGVGAVFRDASGIEPGSGFPEIIRRALGEARVALVVIGQWWLRVTNDPADVRGPRRLDDPSDWVRIEIETLLARDGVAVIPLLLGVGVPGADELPASLRELQEKTGMQLRPYPDFESSLARVIEAVAKHLSVSPRPFASHPQPTTAAPLRVAPTRLSVTGGKFVGREKELHLLDEAWGRSARDKINIVSLIGQGGEGKSAIVLHWYARRARTGWPGARRVFDWSFYSQGTSAQSAAGTDEFFDNALAWFGHTGNAPRDPWTKGETLAALIATERTLLVLDGIEPLQQPPGDSGGEFKDPSMRALLLALAMHNPGLCVLTSRTAITDLQNFEHADGSCVRHPLHALDANAARQLLRHLGVRGSDTEIDEAAREFHGHAYDLNLLGNYLAKCTVDCDIARWRGIVLLREDDRVHGRLGVAGEKEGHGRRMLRAYERWLGPDNPAVAILRLLGLFDRPARSDLLDELRAAPAIPNLTDALVKLRNDEWLRNLDQLQQLGLIERQEDASQLTPCMIGDDVNRDSVVLSEEFRQVWGYGPTLMAARRKARPVSYAVVAHPLLGEHFAAEIRCGSIGAWSAAHRRLYEYLHETTADKPQPTLNDLQPLYQAVAHGCRAGMYQESLKVFADRIRRGNQNYSLFHLGSLMSDLNVLKYFVREHWREIISDLDDAGQAYVLNEVGSVFRFMGRPDIATPLIEQALKLHLTRHDRHNALRSARNLAKTYLLEGSLDLAREYAQQACSLADDLQQVTEQYISHATLARISHFLGRFDDAESHYNRSQQLREQRGDWFTLQESHLCDFYVDQDRVLDALDLARRIRPLKNASLDILNSGLYEYSRAKALLADSRLRPQVEFEEIGEALGKAIKSLTIAGRQDEVGWARLTRASLDLRRDEFQAAERDLLATLKIAKRGNVRPLLVDWCLESARLCLAQKQLESAEAHCLQAEGLISDTSYHRRDKEVAELRSNITALRPKLKMMTVQLSEETAELLERHAAKHGMVPVDLLSAGIEQNLVKIVASAPESWMPLERWEELVRGERCPICTGLQANKPDDGVSFKVCNLSLGQLRLMRNQFVPGYCMLICHEHIREPHELPPTKWTQFFNDLMCVGRALQRILNPAKMNYEIQGNGTPHLHCHVKPRFYGDSAPGIPIDQNAKTVMLTLDEYRERIDAIRQAIRELSIGP